MSQEIPGASVIKNVNGQNKKVIGVKFQDIASQSNSKSRGDRMDLNNGTVKPLLPSNRDTYQ